MKEYITEKYKEGRSKRINRIAQVIRENADNGGNIWERERKLEKKVQAPYSITNTERVKLKNRSGIQVEYITYKMVKKAPVKLKNKRASDRLGWRTQWLKEEGKEIVKSLSIPFNRIEREQRTLTQWRHTII